MARARNPNREKAYELYKKNEGSIKPKKIAGILNENINNVRSWKSQDKWDIRITEDKKVGAPIGNNNAKGHGAPIGNLNAVKTGEYLSQDRFMKGLPKITQKAIEENIQGFSYLDILWMNIQVMSARIITMQKIAHVKNKNDMTKELKKVSEGKISTLEYELQFAWDKENSNISSLSKAMDTLTKMIDKYDKILHANWDLATEEQKLRIEKLKGEVSNLNKGNNYKDITIKVMKASEQHGK